MVVGRTKNSIVLMIDDRRDSIRDSIFVSCETLFAGKSYFFEFLARATRQHCSRSSGRPHLASRSHNLTPRDSIDFEFRAAKSFAYTDYHRSLLTSSASTAVLLNPKAQSRPAIPKMFLAPIAVVGYVQYKKRQERLEAEAAQGGPQHPKAVEGGEIERECNSILNDIIHKIAHEHGEEEEDTILSSSSSSITGGGSDDENESSIKRSKPPVKMSTRNTVIPQHLASLRQLMVEKKNELQDIQRENRIKREQEWRRQFQEQRQESLNRSKSRSNNSINVDGSSVQLW